MIVQPSIVTSGSGRALRIGVAGFLHESNSFLPALTPYEAFASTSLTRGEAMRERWIGASHELGGMLAALGEEAVPLYATFAVPGGAIERGAFERIASELAEAIEAAGPLDGLLLALHGATVADGYPDADGEILSRVRTKIPLVATFDLHANLSPRMVSFTDALIGYRTNPHLDQRERGAEAAKLLREIMLGHVRPVQVCEHLLMLIANSRQHTASEPAAGLYADLAEVLEWPGILTASVAMGFPHSDVEEVGASFLAVADGDEELARKAARWMADRAWQRREQFVSSLPSAAEAVRQAAAAARTPVVLLDTGDNVGGGSAADSTVLMHELRAQGIENGLIVLHAPGAVEQCLDAGVREPVELTAGHPPLEVRGRVRTISDGLFEETAVRHGGWTHNDQGITAVVETDDRQTIVLTSRRMAPFSLEQLLSLGIHPERKRVLVVKGVVAPRAAYEPVAGEFILAGTPGATADDPRVLPYQRRRRPLYPLD
jgi:microcystin degradation protein MlrC